MTTEELHELQRQHTEALRTLAPLQQALTREHWDSLDDAGKAAAALELAEAQVVATDLRNKVMAES